MIVTALPLRGALLLTGEPSRDERGSFRRIVDLTALPFAPDGAVSQLSVATNAVRGTVRGLHYQAPPHEEAKVLWCSQGAIFDVLVDLRPDEPTYGRHWTGELSADAPTALYVPRGLAHGYQVLADDTHVHYAITAAYAAESARTLRWDDPQLAICWPLPVSRISARDREAPPWPPRP